MSMVSVSTHNPPRIYQTADEGVLVDVTFEHEGVAYSVTASAGDGKYFLSRALTVVLDFSARRRVEDGAGLARLGE